MQATHVLLVEDDTSTRTFYSDGLSRRDVRVTEASNGKEALERIESEDFDVVVTDLNMPAFDGLELCSRLAENRPDTPVLVLTGFGSLETAIAALRAGAYDFINKPCELDQLTLAIRRAAADRSLRDELNRLRAEAPASLMFQEIVGRSRATCSMLDMIARVAPTETSVLIAGEKGTGKTLVAHGIHRASRRSAGPFVAINCSELSETALELELFGHVRGAIAKSDTARDGLFAIASGGTIFLDEIGEMPVGMQVKLLRALQERVVRRIGSDSEVPINVRIIAATNRDIDTEVDEKRFREDLFYRLNVVRISVPPLRSRGLDILVLARASLEQLRTGYPLKASELSRAAADRLLSYPWPGNVRELQACMEHATASAIGPEVQLADLPARVREYQGPVMRWTEEEVLQKLPSMEEVESWYIAHVVHAVAGNKTRAAQVLGLDRKTLYRKLERLGL